MSRWHSCTWPRAQRTDDTDGNKCVCLGSGCLSGREPKPDPWWSAHLAMQLTSQLPFFLLSHFQSVIYLNAAAGSCRGQLGKQAWPDVSVCAQASTVVRELSGVSAVRSLIPFIGAPPSWPPQSSASWRHHTGNQDSTCECWEGHRHSVYSAWYFAEFVSRSQSCGSQAQRETGNGSDVQFRA